VEPFLIGEEQENKSSKPKEKTQRPIFMIPL
jgi:hypothetical protein